VRVACGAGKTKGRGIGVVVTGWKNALYGLLLLGGLAALVIVPALVSCALPAQGPPLTDRLDIGYGATIQPPPGARLDLTESRPGSGDLLVRAGEVEVRLTARSFRGDPGPYVAHAKHKLSRDDSLRPAGAPEPLRTASGVAGERGSLVPADADADPGCYAVLTARSVGIVVLVTPVSGCAELPVPVRDAMASIEIAAAGTA
jgi:hypothetical protein